MEAEEFLDNVHPNCVENDLSTPTDEISTSKIGGESLVAVTSNEFVDVQDILEHFHPIGECEKNITSTNNDTKGEDGDSVIARSKELMEVGDFLKDVHLIGDSKEKVMTPVDDVRTKKVGDGEIVSCINDVCMEVKDFLDNMQPIRDNERNDIPFSNDEIPTRKCKDPGAVVENTIAQQNAERSNEQCNARPKGVVSSSATKLNDIHIRNGEEQSKIVDESIISESSGPSCVTFNCSKPDFSKLKGKICLDNLSVRDLQETFRAAFGRETSVKDKQWLKRRISMGLSNSCHILSMTFVIDQCNKVKIVQEGVEHTLAADLVVGEMNETYGGLPMGVGNQLEDPENLSRNRLINPIVGCDCNSVDQQSSGIGTKRVHKLTKRYIKDLVVGEMNENEDPENVSVQRLINPSAGHGCNSKDQQCSGVGIKRSRKPTKRYIEELGVGDMDENYGGFPVGADNQFEDPENVSGERLINPSAGHDCNSEDQENSGIGTKRVRKPTKRYIEELSELESKENNGNLLLVSKNPGHDRSSSRPCVRPTCDAQSVWRPLVTRRDSLGGSGVEVPYVCRIRRSRPRENYMAFMKLRPGSMNVTNKLVQEALGSSIPLDDEREKKGFSAGSASACDQKHIVDETETERQYQERETFEPEKDGENVEQRQENPPEDNSDNDTSYVDASKGGVRRKHHRLWSLTEVVNLVNGVAKFGVGRWSEIKRLSFASHSYRTPVDLKDKWRNLLRASFAQTAEKGNSRKQILAPIPPQILIRVRELAKMHSQVPPILNSSKLKGDNSYATSPGYL